MENKVLVETSARHVHLTEEAIAAFRADIEASKQIVQEGLPKEGAPNEPSGSDYADHDKYPNLDVQKLARSFFHFHHNLCVYSGNFVLPLIFNTFKDSTSYFWEQPIREFGPERCIEFMEAMLEAVLTGDAKQSKAYLHAQLELYRDVIAGRATFYIAYRNGASYEALFFCAFSAISLL